jgi:hypothetical protein
MMRQRSAIGAVVLLAAAGIGLAACSNGVADGGKGGTGTPTTFTPVTVSGADPTGVTIPSSQIIPYSKATNARPDVTASAQCLRSPRGLWTWSGTVTNTTSRRHTYLIIVDFTDAVATVEATKVIQVIVTAGRTAHWSVDGAAGQTGIECVIQSARVS